MLSQPSKNKPHPTRIDAKNEAINAIRSALLPLERILNQNERNKREFDEVGYYNPLSCALTQMFDDKHHFMEAAFHKIQEYELDIPVRKPIPERLKLEAVLDAKQMLSPWLAMPFDKNAGKTAVMCPMRYWQVLKKEFLEDDQHYDILHMTEESEVLDTWRSVFRDNGWQKLGKLFESGRIPDAYSVPKHKDFDRHRNIVSYFAHPLRQIYRKAQRAFLFCIRNAPDKRYDLDSTAELLPKAKLIETELQSVFGEHTGFLPFSKDVKEMFTRLPHREIEKAADWVLKKVKSNTRRSNVCVPNRKTAACSFGTSTNSFESRTVSFAKIMEILRFDLSQAIFRLGDTLLKQKEGAPIGGILSTAMAICVCFYSEHHFYLTLRADERLFRHNRYVDDAWGIVAYDRRDKESYLHAKSLVEKFANHCYPKQLILEDEKIENGNFNFLEGGLQVKENTIQCCFRSKNYKSVLETGKPKFYNMQHAESYAPLAAKKGVLHARLLTIQSYSGSPVLLVQSAGRFVYEMQSVGYSRQMLRKACNKVFFSTGDCAWKQVSKLLKIK